MELKEVIIEKYKSINNPIVISLNKSDRFFTFIGKNGSGKTNLLQAIRKTLTKRTYHDSEKETLSAKYKYIISQEEKDQYFSVIDLQSVTDEIDIVFNGNEPNVKKLDSPLVRTSVKGYKQKIEALHNRFGKASKKYIFALRKIETDYGKMFYLCPNVKDTNTGRIFQIQSSQIDLLNNNLNIIIDNIKRYLDSVFEGDYISLNSNKLYTTPLSIYEVNFRDFEIENQLEISPIVAKSLELNNDDLAKVNERLKKELENINEALKSEYKEIQNCINEFNEITGEIEHIFTIDQDAGFDLDKEREETAQSFYKLLQQVAFKTTYYIDNENSLLFYDRSNTDYYKQETIFNNLNSRNPIMEAIDSFLKENNYYSENESILEYNKIPSERLKKMVNIVNNYFLNRIVPEFDKDEIRGFRLEVNNNSLMLVVIEKNGVKVNIDETSLGRRWYLTYNFVKQLLKPDDMLFIDEPAAFLHPQAQAEFKKDLQELSKNGIYVFITTHSPYMIPENWSNVYNVVMSENGTTIQNFGDEDEICMTIKNGLGVLETNNILFDLSKTLLLVEGIADKACVEKFAKKCGYNINNYSILPCNGHPIIGIAYLCIKENIKFKALLDLDNKNKPEGWLEHQYGYKDFLKIIKENKDCVFTPNIGKQKSLEDCFSEKDAKKYFYKKPLDNGCEWKISETKVLEGEVFDQETLQNFEKLFIQLGIPKIDK